ncbi:ATP dependant DNA helicase [Chondrus crispus]|uniref:ATP-dependent DNA helicase n=1 Tax=Chondrus crispus TaxID=2769 RepID=R7QR78_CHOCR|nr:ATP dependant DNA helicase [Chondrus crispus]CDF39890.1 ATP dependant DNA helicase [Chondrus crispus]|eukprot:XP_005710184.1 ATP dependant DNA helicase [Chondrus crispus]
MVIHADRRPSYEHVRQYNGPEASEVAALIPGNENGEIGRRDIVVCRRGTVNSNGNEVLDPISVSHRAYDPLSYVLLFPNGRDGWYPELRFSIDQFCKVEAERLSYLRHNQTQLRAADYTSLRDSLGDSGRAEDETDAVRAGRLFILPSTHIGCDRYMRQHMHGIIAISNQIGHPDIFLTMTCNPCWPEITRALLPNQTSQDRLDLCARVFRLKMKDLMSLVINEDVFGTVVAHVRVIKFQKRGFPHAHVVFFLDEVSKNDLRNPENVDRIISAEIPSAQDPELQEVVLKHMIHNPCGERNPTAVCMGEQYCRKRFPKPIKHETSQSESGVSIGRPSRIGRRQQSVVVDNSWFVPHSPLLLRSSALHLNVELCVSRVGGIRYLFKYVCKGQDRVIMEITAKNECYDEISNFQDARYVSASEAAWRLFSFDILSVHLPNHHMVYFEEGREQEAALRPASGTKLTEWFKANENYPSARHIRYHKFPKYFTWKKSSKSWTYDFSGTGANVVGRIYTVSPREGEPYFLRLLITQVPGATSFENLRNIDGEQCTSFRQACLRLGLLANDADSFAMITTPQLTCLERYRRPCRRCVPTGRSHTSDSHSPMTACPLRNRQTRSRHPKHKRSSVSVSALLQGSSSAVAGPSMPTQSSRLFFLDAPGGTGKTFVLSAIQDFLRSRPKQVIAVAISAVAAVLLDGGRTAHSVFKISIPVSAESTYSFSTNSDTGRTLQQVDLIIWDEIVMCYRNCIETVDRSLRDLMQADRPFGGKFLVLAGDFRRILPVVPGGSRGQIVSACVKSSPLYRECRFLCLTENMRLTALQGDPAADVEALNFPQFLLSVGEGRLQCDQRPEWISLPQSVAFEHTIRNLCLKVFHGIRDNHADPTWLTKRVILTTKNRPLEQVNEVIGNMMPGPYRTYLSADKVESEDTNALIYPTEMLNTLTAGSDLPDHKLKLKKGFIVMLLRNLDPTSGHVNGARYVMEKMTNNLFFLRVTSGSHEGNRLCLPRMPCGPGDDKIPFLALLERSSPFARDSPLQRTKPKASPSVAALVSTYEIIASRTVNSTSHYRGLLTQATSLSSLESPMQQRET